MSGFRAFSADALFQKKKDVNYEFSLDARCFNGLIDKDEEKWCGRLGSTDIAYGVKRLNGAEFHYTCFIFVGNRGSVRSKPVEKVCRTGAPTLGEWFQFMRTWKFPLRFRLRSL